MWKCRKSCKLFIETIESFKVIYPSLMKDKYIDRAKKYLQKGFGALVGFELKDGEESGRSL